MIAVVWGIVLLSRPRVSSWDLTGAVLLAVIASYSVEAGFLFWGIGFVLLGAGRLPYQQKKVFLMVWAACALSAAALFLIDYNPRQALSGIPGAFRDPLGCVKYYLDYLGAYLTVVYAFIPGVAGLACFTGTTLYLARRSGIDRMTYLPFLSLGFFALASGLGIAGVRFAGDVMAEAVTVRYVRYSLYFWLSNLVLAVMVWEDWKKESGLTKKNRLDRLGRSFLGVTAVVLVGLSLATVIVKMRPHSMVLRQARAELSRLENDDLLQFIYGNPEIIRQRIGLLKKYRLSLFRQTGELPDGNAVA
jgi:hypothetical protein